MRTLSSLSKFVVLPLAAILVACTTATPAPTSAPGATEAPAATEAPPAATEASAATEAPATAAPAAEKGGELTIGMGYEAISFDPHVGPAYDQMYIHMNVFDPLIWQAPDGSFVAGLAESWEVNADSTEFTFHLRQDVTFHDGTPFNAEAVKFSFDRIMSPDFFSLIRDRLGPYDQTEVVDEYTVKVSFTSPYVPFLAAVSQWWLVPVSPAAVEQYGEDFGSNLVGTGPFMWQERVPQDHITLVRNPDYNWGPSFMKHQGPAYLEQITFKFIPEEGARTGTLESGEIDMAQDVPPVDIQRLEGDPNYALYRELLPGQPTLLYVNTENMPTGDLAVREALQWATPKQQLIDAMWGGYYDPAYGPISPGLIGFSDAWEGMYGYDAEQAKQILDGAGWTDADGDGIREKDGQPLALAMNTMAFNRYPEVLQLLVAAWKEVGMDAQLAVVDWPQFSGQAWENKHNLMPYFTPTNDPYFITNSFYLSANADQGFNFARLRDPQVDELLTAAVGENDAAARQQEYEEAGTIIMEQAAVLPLYVSYNLSMASASVKDLTFWGGWWPLLYDVYIEE